MSLVERWPEAVNRIEQEHAALLSCADQFIGDASRGSSRQLLHRSLRLLVDQLATHFSTEEQLMHRTDYPERHSHHLLHAACLQQFEHELEHLSLAGSRGAESYREMIGTWILNHLRLQDRRFEDFLAGASRGDPVKSTNSMQSSASGPTGGVDGIHGME